MDRKLRFGWAGLASGPGAWALSTQGLYAAGPFACAHGPAVHVAAATILAVAAFAGGGFSALALQAGVNGGHDAGAASRTLLSALGALAGLVFGLVMSFRASPPR